jgi:hypothetical protein
MQKVRISLDVVNPSESHNIGIELRIDDVKFFDSIVAPGTHHIVHEFDEDETEHCLYIVMKGKTQTDTEIDDQGNIVNDAVIDIKNVSLDEINIDRLIHDLGQYIHDGNGAEPVQSIHRFYGHLGCNGRVQLKFACPVYLWFLENM